jgi:Uncharacterised conserved protein (DUF2228)
MESAEQRVRDFYGFAFPDDFFRFREFMARLPTGILGKACDMYPSYPFDLADGKPPANYPDRPHWAGRYYNDLPEFITLFEGTTDGLHYGYFFDSPGELPPIVVNYWHSDAFQHAINGDTLFEATRWFVEKVESDYETDDDPGEVDERQELLAVIRTELAAYWGADREEIGTEYVRAFDGSSWRKPAAKTWDDLGIVVKRRQYKKLSTDPFTGPFNGYRVNPQRPQIEELAAEAMGLLRAGFPGAALKLGRDLWLWAGEFPECYALLDEAYTALGREPLHRLLVVAREWRQRCDGQRRQRPS